MNFLVQLTVNLPYPKTFEFRVKASNFGLAAKRAFQLARKEELKGRKLKDIKFNIIHF